MIKTINNLKINLNEKEVKKLNLDLLEKLYKKLKTFSNDCKECSDYLNRLEKHIQFLEENQYSLTKDIYKRNDELINDITTHIREGHNIIQEDYYTGIYTALGISIGSGLGVSIGLLIFDNIGLGIPIGTGLGTSIGLVIGANMDKKAKEEGRVI